jgi:hypothetical protein
MEICRGLDPTGQVIELTNFHKKSINVEWIQTATSLLLVKTVTSSLMI